MEDTDDEEFSDTDENMEDESFDNVDESEY
jgi:hypothetical protein